jgi:hypothetical protein
LQILHVGLGIVSSKKVQTQDVFLDFCFGSGTIAVDKSKGDVKEDEVDGGGATVSWGCGVGKLVAELDAIVLICICAKCLIYARRHTFLQVATVATKQRYVIDHRSSIIRSYGVFTIRLLVVGKWLVNLPVVVGKCNSLDYRPVNLPTTFGTVR